MSRQLSAVSLQLAFCLIAATAHARTKTYAVIIAENRSLDPGVKPLQFADDDGAKTWELFSLFADRTALFVVLDADTARLHPDAARAAESPERAAIFDKLARYNVEMAHDVDRGDVPELFFIYAGHGDVDGTGQGYVNLRDAKLTRAELYRDIIAPSKAKFVHVIVDACKSYFLVNARGSNKRWVDDSVPPEEGAAGDAHLQAFLEEEQLERHPRAGVIVATSGDQETHEWARYRGGILSHELRSALSGAADVNGDGRIEYSELRAFLAAANARVRNPEARVDVFARAPALDRHRALVDLRQASPLARYLHFGAGLGGRFYVEDDRGVRIADLNKEANASFDVMVSSRHAYYVRSEDQEAEARIGERRLEVSSLPWHARAIAARGAIDATFRNDLYREPYGRGFYDGFVATSGDLPVEDSAAPFLVSKPPPRLFPRHRLSFAYTLTSGSIGNSGLSQGFDIRYAFRYWRVLDLGLSTQFGAGTPALGTLLRTAVLVVFGAEVWPIVRLGLRLDTGIGWQLYNGTVELGGQKLTGTEPRGLRYELAGGIIVRL
ncbi:MAG TPA: hypothetical protein VF334_14790, partial [Polyangia bacterium]